MEERICYKQIPIYFFLAVIYFFPKSAFAAAPFISDDADVLASQHFQLFIYSKIYSKSYSSDLGLPTIELDYGLIKNIEIDLTTQISTNIPTSGNSTIGLGDSEIKLKYKIIKETINYPEISIEPTLELPTGNAERNLGNGKTWYQLPLWIEKSWNSWTTYGGGGYAINSAPDAKNYFFGGWVLQKNFSYPLAIGLELYTQGATAKHNISDSGSYTLVDIGATYNLNSYTTLLFSVGHNVLGQALWYAYLGLNFQL